jgi:hypothetical protein
MIKSKMHRIWACNLECFFLEDKFHNSDSIDSNASAHSVVLHPFVTPQTWEFAKSLNFAMTSYPKLVNDNIIFS